MADAKPPAKKPSAPPPAASFLSMPHMAEIIVAIVLIIALLPFVSEIFFPSENGGVMSGVIAEVVSFVKIASSVVVMIALVIAVYSFMRVREIAKEETQKLGLVLNWHSEKKQKNARWEKVEQYMISPNPSDWKIAILEADNILDEIVERMGYKGPTLGERMKNIEASDFPYLDEAWQAHKLRNSIAHKGTDYPLSRSEAEQAINMYHKVFKELGYLSL